MKKRLLNNLVVSEIGMGCMERLQTDYIDLYYLHRVDHGIPVKGFRGHVEFQGGMTLK